MKIGKSEEKFDFLFFKIFLFRGRYRQKMEKKSIVFCANHLFFGPKSTFKKVKSALLNKNNRNFHFFAYFCYLVIGEFGA